MKEDFHGIISVRNYGRQTLADYRRVLVTGGAGFIGSNYVHLALKRHPDWEIVVLDKLTYAGNMENLKDILPKIRFIKGDITNQSDVRNAFEGIDAVINFAAESHVDRSLRNSRVFVRTNVEGTLILLEEARRSGIKRFLQVSTDEVYGDLAGTAKHSVETDSLRPCNPYAASKAAAEHLVYSYATCYGIDTVITRGSNTYGPYQNPEKIIPLFLTNALENKPLPLYGNGTAVRDYMHVEDHASGIDLVLHQGESLNAYNLGACIEISGNEIAASILELIGKSSEMVAYVQDRPGHDYRYSVDPGKAEALGWKRQWNFTKGLASTKDWYLNHRDWWQKVKAATTGISF